MLNLIRADWYRLLRSTIIHMTFVFYLCFIVFLALVVLDSGYEALTSMAHLAESVVLFMLPVLFAVAAADFQYGTMKNVLAGGAPRIKIYASKWLVAILFCTIMYVGIVVLTTLAGTALYGFGTDLTAALAISALQTAVIHLALLIGAVSVGVSVTFLSKSAVAFASVYALFFYATYFALYAASVYLDNPALEVPSFIANMRMIGIESLPPGDAVQALSVAAAYIVGSAVLGIWFFRSSEI